MDEKLRSRLSGVVTIPVTPFDEAGEIDTAALGRIVERMSRAGIDVFTPNGNTGEFYSLTADERSLMLDTVVAAAPGATILAGVGGSARDAADAAVAARTAGAHAVMTHQPVHPYLTPQGWVEYNAAVAEAVPELGLVTYVKNRNVSAAAIVELHRRCPNFIGVKYALADPVDFAAMRAETESADVVWIAGLAESYAPAHFAVGATGFTSGLANVVPDLSLRFFDALTHHDDVAVQTLWREIREFEYLRTKQDSAWNVSVVKEALAQLGLCRREVRAPITELDPSDRERVTDILQQWNTSAQSSKEVSSPLVGTGVC